MKNITVIGSGTMGNGIAHCFAQNKFNVQLVDLSEYQLERALAVIQKNLDRQVTRAILTEAEKEASINRIQTSTDLDKALANADLVIEAASENIGVKEKLFRQMDAVASKDCILATNTSSISITKLASFTNRPEKVIGIHFMNPVPVMRLIEVIQGFKTDEQTLNQILDLSKQLDKIPLLAQDYPGFVANRILLPMINEAIETLFQGIGGVYEIDHMMKLGMGHPMGPLQLADFIGLDVCLSVLEVLHEGFGAAKYAPAPLLVNMVQAGNLGVKSGIGFYDYRTDRRNPTIATQFL
ncbi:3-hydroxyacyl-CoA dehydrogenase NAD-binding domain-containing protein [Flavobacteriaceae bacterium]|nr:3-hydroxyacyl-CoA dehydrogenase NAD-binding domain-containing protein [Flavobacteriaceae bacterium]MDB9988436.1 3-hydroxyacyl-CoA dehydrogenase NAD-binding domain-containing protein [Flavobacteriaceae bacterium]|tara:strand:+ start:2995 stop:3882 length:888 start_codon:yes stop_codon:yes gene_type:complete